MNLELLVKQAKRESLYIPAAADRLELGGDAIERLIPHRDPFRFVDLIDAADLAAGKITGRRTWRASDPMFAGHFPGEPIVPGVLQVEAMGQLGVCLFALQRNAETPTQVRALKIHHALFVAAVRPDDELRLVAVAIEANDYTAICAGQLYANGALASVAVMEVYFVD